MSEQMNKTQSVESDVDTLPVTNHSTDFEDGCWQESILSLPHDAAIILCRDVDVADGRWLVMLEQSSFQAHEMTAIEFAFVAGEMQRAAAIAHSRNLALGFVGDLDPAEV
jgi:hypothetical protein